MSSSHDEPEDMEMDPGLYQELYQDPNLNALRTTGAIVDPPPPPPVVQLLPLSANTVIRIRAPIRIRDRQGRDITEEIMSGGTARIRDPNQGGRDITEEIMSGGTARIRDPNQGGRDITEEIMSGGTARIRDPNQGGRDITEEIMSGGTGSPAPSMPPVGRPSSTPTSPQVTPHTEVLSSAAEPFPQRGQEVSVPFLLRGQDVNVPFPQRGQEVNVPFPQRGQEVSVPFPLRGQVVNVPFPQRGQEVSVPFPLRGQEVSVPFPQRGQEVNVPFPLRGQEVSVPFPPIGQECVEKASASSLLSEEHFLCSICLEVFTDPITTPCGHNYCNACITHYWDHSDASVCKCPLCNKTFYRRPECSVNKVVSEMADQFRKSKRSSTNREPAKPDEVSCDSCTEPKLKALKSCLVCMASYCETHLEPHLRATVFRRHKLIDPVKNLEDITCQKHDRPLELFCKTDHVCVCQFCTQADHKSHQIVSLKEAYDGKKAELGKTEAEVQQMIRERQVKIHKVKRSVVLSKKAADREIADSVKVFTALISCIERSQAEVRNVIEEKQKSTEKQAEGFIKELQLEITQLEKRSSELKQLSHTEDHIQLLQNFTPINIPAPIKDWTKVIVHPCSYVGTARRALDHLKKTLSKEMEKQIREQYQDDHSYLGLPLTNLQGVLGKPVFKDRDNKTKIGHASHSDKPSARTAAVAGGATAAGETKEDFPICCESRPQMEKLPCGHELCKDWKMWLEGPVCPWCKDVFGKMEGDQPPGTMSCSYANFSLPGFRHCGTITIDYNIPSGTQTKKHPNPGKHYSGTQRTAYLPDNEEGREVVRLLKKAFDQKLIFTVGTSRTNGLEDQVTWNDIHHKTNLGGGPQGLGYPDDNYLSRVRDELYAKGIK